MSCRNCSLLQYPKMEYGSEISESVDLSPVALAFFVVCFLLVPLQRERKVFCETNNWNVLHFKPKFVSTHKFFLHVSVFFSFLNFLAVSSARWGLTSWGSLLPWQQERRSLQSQWSSSIYNELERKSVSTKLVRPTSINAQLLKERDHFPKSFILEIRKPGYFNQENSLFQAHIITKLLTLIESQRKKEMLTLRTDVIHVDWAENIIKCIWIQEGNWDATNREDVEFKPALM